MESNRFYPLTYGSPLQIWQDSDCRVSQSRAVKVMSSDMVYLLKAQLVEGTGEKKGVVKVTKSEECEQCGDLSSFKNVTDYLQHYREELNYINLRFAGTTSA